MDVEDLRYFVAVYEAEGFSRASRRLGTVQSNVSSCVRNLEKSLGVELFERRYRNLEPTEGGERLYRYARHVIDAVDLTEKAFRPARAARSAGFTLLELLVVVAIIGVLAGFVAPRYFGQVGKSEVNTARAQIDALEKALDQYRLDVGRYPSNELGLKALVEKPASEPKWNGPYLKKAVPLDPWGQQYVYKFPGQKGDFDLISYGRDRQAGGSGEDADITNH
jgi:general secretion pathway protein G